MDLEEHEANCMEGAPLDLHSGVFEQRPRSMDHVLCCFAGEGNEEDLV